MNNDEILQIITSLGIEKYIYQHNTSRFLKKSPKDFKYRDLISLLWIWCPANTSQDLGIGTFS
jgi:hypothetical protein